MEVNNIYDLLLKVLLLKNSTLSKLLVLFPRGISGVTISALQAELKNRTDFCFSKGGIVQSCCQCPAQLQRSLRHQSFCWTPPGLLNSPGPRGCPALRPCHGKQPSHPTPRASASLWRGIPPEFRRTFIHLLPLGVFCRCLRSCCRAGRSRALHGEGTEPSLSPALRCACLGCRPSALSPGNRSSQLGLLI